MGWRLARTHPCAIRMLIAVLAAVSLSGCRGDASGPPEIIVDRTACSHCRMLISEPSYAAAYRAPGGESRVFDDIGCLLAAARAETTGDLHFWFHDMKSGNWIDGRKAVFVRSAEIHTPMGGGLMAFATRDDASAAAIQYRGNVLASLDELLAHVGGRP
jgi:copper chaperone NosL